MISALLPFRDASSTLRAALESLLAEREVGEVVAVDDGSLDASAAIALEVASRDPRVRVLRGHARGIVSALNNAVSHARGDLLARMDADDISLPGRVAASAAMLRSDPALGAVGTQVSVVGAGDGMRAYAAWQNSLITPRDHAREIFVEAPLCHPSATLRRSALQQIGGYNDCAWPEDWDLWLRMDARGWSLAKVPEVLFEWRHGPGRLTFSHPRYALDRFVEARAAYLPARLSGVTRGRALVYWGAGPTGKRLARSLEKQGVRAVAFVDIDPRKLGVTARGLPIVDQGFLSRERHFVIVAVGARGARSLVRAHLRDRGWIEGNDWLAAA